MAFWDEKIGPLPVWVWAVGIAGLTVVFLLLRKRGQGSTFGAPFSEFPPLAPPAPASGGTDLSALAPIFEHMAELQQQQNQQFQELMTALTTGMQQQSELLSGIGSAITQQNAMMLQFAQAMSEGFRAISQSFSEMRQSMAQPAEPVIIVATPQTSSPAISAPMGGAPAPMVSPAPVTPVPMPAPAPAPLPPQSLSPQVIGPAPGGGLTMVYTDPVTNQQAVYQQWSRPSNVGQYPNEFQGGVIHTFDEHGRPITRTPIRVSSQPSGSITTTGAPATRSRTVKGYLFVGTQKVPIYAEE